MLNHSIQQMIPQIQGYLSEQPVNKAWLFGPYSHGEETPDSDIDLMVELYRQRFYILIYHFSNCHGVT